MQGRITMKGKIKMTERTTIKTDIVVGRVIMGELIIIVIWDMAGE